MVYMRQGFIYLRLNTTSKAYKKRPHYLSLINQWLMIIRQLRHIRILFLIKCRN